MQIKIVSLNIWNGGRLFAPMLDFLKKERADIYALQEVTRGGDSSETEECFHSFEILCKELNLPSATFSPAFLDESSSTESGNAIFSRFPHRDYPPIFFDTPYRKLNLPRLEKERRGGTIPRALMRVDATLPTGKTLEIFNTQGIWGPDSFDTPRRVEMGRRIAEETGLCETAILCGDFNVEIKSESLRPLKKHLVNVFADRKETTLNVRHHKTPAAWHNEVDSVFVSPHIRIISREMPQVDVSDHLPHIVVVEV